MASASNEFSSGCKLADGVLWWICSIIYNEKSYCCPSSINLNVQDFLLFVFFSNARKIYSISSLICSNAYYGRHNTCFFSYVGHIWCSEWILKRCFGSFRWELNSPNHCNMFLQYTWFWCKKQILVVRLLHFSNTLYMIKKFVCTARYPFSHLGAPGRWDTSSHVLPNQQQYGMCFMVVLWFSSVLPLSYRVTSLTLDKSWHFLSLNESTLKNMGPLTTWIDGN